MEQEHGPQYSNASDEPLYNIGVVSRMTGISVATLRAWERRYGFPSSGRTAGGHRLYSEKDMVRLRWVKGQIDQGMQTAQAIQVLRHREMPERTVRETARLAPSSTAALVAAHIQMLTMPDVDSADIAFDEAANGPDAALARYREELAGALIQYDVAAADRVLGEALLSYSLEDLIFRVIEPAFVAIGQAWEEQRISIAMEHLTTHYLRHRLLMWMLSGPPLYPIKPVVLACAPGELHEGSLLILGALLRRRRWPVAYLGQTVPLADLATLIHDMQPPIVVLVAMTEEPARALLNWAQDLPEAAKTGQPVIAYGGKIFSDDPSWREHMQGIFLGTTLQEGIRHLDDILTRTLASTEGILDRT
jgi:MerR family transcriptional regulator, light-induced transcriptional regulator